MNDLNDNQSLTTIKKIVAGAPIVGDLKDRNNRAALAARIKTDIDAWAVKTFDDGHRTHLGASLIGRPCSRYLWYTFRWVQKPSFNGRMQRLFQRGHREEAWYIEMLEGIGARVEYEDTSVPMALFYHPESDSYIYDNPAKATQELCDVTGDPTSEANAMLAGVFPVYPQFRISACEGHFGGSLDAKIWLPEHYGIPMMFINEYKTQGTAKFSKMTVNGVQLEKPEHYVQMSMYGWKNNTQYGLYMATNKNDDDLHVEVVELDFAMAERMELKAHNIIFSRTPPQKLSESIAHSVCGYCDFKGVCHQNVPYEKSCRSCEYVEAIPNKQWGCHKYANVIPVDFISKGCDAWKPAL